MIANISIRTPHMQSDQPFQNTFGLAIPLHLEGVFNGGGWPAGDGN
jgi:hypothetical protein